MMTGRLSIDGLDVYRNYGLYATDQGYNGMIQWAASKPVLYNDWYEEDGIEPDLSTLALDGRTCKLRLTGSIRMGNIQNLTSNLTNNAYHFISIPEIGLTFRNLRYVGSTPPRIIDSLWSVELTFADDNPTKPSKATPTSNIPSSRDYTIDDLPFTRYGVRMLSDTLASFYRIPERKENWQYNVEGVNGIITGDADGGHIKDYDVTLRCLMRADTLDELWKNYNALYGQFASAGAHYVTVNANRKSYPCYYLSQRVRRFYHTGKIWLEFDVMLKVYTTPTNI